MFFNDCNSKKKDITVSTLNIDILLLLGRKGFPLFTMWILT